MGVKDLWSKVKSEFLDLWDRSKVVLILLGALALFLKYRDLILSILINSSKRLDKNAHTKDDRLVVQERQSNQQADQLVQQAKEEPAKEVKIDDDWYKSKK